MKRDDRHKSTQSKLNVYIWTEIDQNKIFPKNLVGIFTPNFTQIH